MTYRFEIKNNNYCLIFSDGLILKERIRNPNTIDYKTEKPVVITNFKRPDDRWTYYALFSNGEIEKYEVNRCRCLLPKEFKGMSPVDYEMYILLFENWIEKGKLTYSKENRDNIKDVVKQFDENGRWLDDLNYHKFICNQCSDELIISINTYRGGGGFERNE
ncbi:hypothetical protein GCM10009117_00150 [Gangjinia marincola]|uniref:Uncharacterized protein n=1 Tax=Gangjinia marincola TaxID=578463 RepID=A0ABN1MCQ2_9FLAO